MVVRTSAERPVKFTFAFEDPEIVDAGDAAAHQALLDRLGLATISGQVAFDGIGRGVKGARIQLIDARDNLKRQIEILQSPMRFSDVYPEGIAKLRATLAEIESCLADMDNKKD